MARKMKKNVFIVEGKDDTARLRLALGPKQLTIETGGSRISPQVLAKIKRFFADDNYQLILLTDPDYQGKRIRKKITALFPGIAELFLTREQAHPLHSGSLGVENADPKVLADLIRTNIKTPVFADGSENDSLTISDLYDLQLIGKPESAAKRAVLAEKFHLQAANGKQFLKELNLFSVSKKDLERAVEKFE
ncbi:toprim domain-containing protein [Oenococcus alcoholitolerans]